jgi:hypothetical protein
MSWCLLVMAASESYHVAASCWTTASLMMVLLWCSRLSWHRMRRLNMFLTMWHPCLTW